MKSDLSPRLFSLSYFKNIHGRICKINVIKTIRYTLRIVKYMYLYIYV